MNKNIFILWFQGFENAPDIVKRCVQSWKYYNSDWNIILLDNTNLTQYVNLKEYIDISKKQIQPCHLSDIYRMILLKNHGGLWTDATTFCNKPLNDWLPNYIQQGFFAFNKPAPDRLVSNWFIYAEKNNYIIELWCNATINYYIRHNKAETYFIHHYIFGNIYKQNKNFKDIWDKVPKLSANGIGPHYLQEKGLFSNITVKTKNDIDKKSTPLYKLTYKCKFPPYNKNMHLYYLYSTIN